MNVKDDIYFDINSTEIRIIQGYCPFYKTLSSFAESDFIKLKKEKIESISFSRVLISQEIISLIKRINLKRLELWKTKFSEEVKDDFLANIKDCDIRITHTLEECYFPLISEASNSLALEFIRIESKIKSELNRNIFQSRIRTLRLLGCYNYNLGVAKAIVNLNLDELFIGDCNVKGVEMLLLGSIPNAQVSKSYSSFTLKNKQSEKEIFCWKSFAFRYLPYPIHGSSPVAKVLYHRMLTQPKDILMSSCKHIFPEFCREEVF